MAITIDDVCDKNFGIVAQGFNPSEVDSFLNEIVDQMYAYEETIKQLNEQADALKHELEMERNAAKPAETAPVKEQPAQPAAPAGNVTATSVALEGILRQAQMLADNEVEEARAKAAKILQDAQDEATVTINDAQKEKGLLAEQNESLRNAVASYRKDFTGLLEKYKNLLEQEELFTR